MTFPNDRSNFIFSEIEPPQRLEPNVGELGNFIGREVENLKLRQESIRLKWQKGGDLVFAEIEGDKMRKFQKDFWIRDGISGDI